MNWPSKHLDVRSLALKVVLGTLIFLVAISFSHISDAQTFRVRAKPSPFGGVSNQTTFFTNGLSVFKQPDTLPRKYAVFMLNEYPWQITNSGLIFGNGFDSEGQEYRFRTPQYGLATQGRQVIYHAGLYEMNAYGDACGTGGFGSGGSSSGYGERYGGLYPLSWTQQGILSSLPVPPHISETWKFVEIDEVNSDPNDPQSSIILEHKFNDSYPRENPGGAVGLHIDDDGTIYGAAAHGYATVRYEKLGDHGGKHIYNRNDPWMFQTNGYSWSGNASTLLGTDVSLGDATTDVLLTFDNYPFFKKLDFFDPTNTPAGGTSITIQLQDHNYSNEDGSEQRTVRDMPYEDGARQYGLMKGHGIWNTEFTTVDKVKNGHKLITTEVYQDGYKYLQRFQMLDGHSINQTVNAINSEGWALLADSQSSGDGGIIYAGKLRSAVGAMIDTGPAYLTGMNARHVVTTTLEGDVIDRSSPQLIGSFSYPLPRQYGDDYRATTTFGVLAEENLETGIYETYDLNQMAGVPSGWLIDKPTDINDQGAITALMVNTSSGESKGAILLPVEVVRDDALRTDDDDLSVKLDDWPQSGTNLRSPKYIFAEEDNIFVKVTGPQGLGNNKLKVKVTSETDTTGITFDLAEISPGVFVNKSPAKPLRLGKTTETKPDCVKIKVVDEEVLKFNLIFDGTDTGKFADVMVDRGEFASAGITVFYGSATGDRSTVRDQAITNTKFSDVGDGNYANNIAATGTALFDFAKNFGANQTDNLEADFLHISAHGDNDGKIYDDAGAVAVNPSNLAGEWNTDAEWAMLATCNQLNVAGGGRAAWEPALNGSPRKAHVILGAYKPLSGDLRSQLSAFWTDMRQNRELILDAYGDAMGSGADPQPWAFLVNTGNIQDKLKEVTRDTSGTVSFVYLDVDALCGRAGGLGDRSVTQVIDGGNGLVRTDLPTVEGRRMRKTFKLSPSSDLSKSKKLAFVKGVTSLPDGRHNFVGRKTSKVLFEKSTLTKEQAGEIAKHYLAEHFPEFASRVQLKDVGQKMKGDWLPNGGETSQINGYLVRFSVMNGDVPVWENYVNVTINGNQVDGVDFRVYQQTNQAKSTITDENAVQPLDVRTGLAKALPRLKKELTIKGKYEILRAELCYVNQAVASGNQADLNDDFVPAWHLVVNSEYDGENSVRHLFHVWMDALTGEIISKKPY